MGQEGVHFLPKPEMALGATVCLDVGQHKHAPGIQVSGIPHCWFCKLSCIKPLMYNNLVGATCPNKVCDFPDTINNNSKAWKCSHLEAQLGYRTLIWQVQGGGIKTTEKQMFQIWLFFYPARRVANEFVAWMLRQIGNYSYAGQPNMALAPKSLFVPIQCFLWSMFLIQRWFSNKISLNYCKHRSSPGGRIRGNSIVGNATWSKINLAALLSSGTFSYFLLSFILIDSKRKEKLHAFFIFIYEKKNQKLLNIPCIF